MQSVPAWVICADDVTSNALLSRTLLRQSALRMQHDAGTMRKRGLASSGSWADCGLSVLKVMKALGAAWSTLSVSEKEAYKGKVGQSS